MERERCKIIDILGADSGGCKIKFVARNQVTVTLKVVAKTVGVTAGQVHASAYILQSGRDINGNLVASSAACIAHGHAAMQIYLAVP